MPLRRQCLLVIMHLIDCSIRQTDCSIKEYQSWEQCIRVFCCSLNSLLTVLSIYFQGVITKNIFTHCASQHSTLACYIMPAWIFWLNWCFLEHIIKFLDIIILGSLVDSALGGKCIHCCGSVINLADTAEFILMLPW